MTSNNKRLSYKSFMRKLVKIMLAISAFILVCAFICVGVLLACSPGIPKPFLDSNEKPLAGSFSEKIQVKINGVEQGMCILSFSVS